MLISLGCFLLSILFPDIFSPLFDEKLSKGEIRLLFGSAVIVFIIIATSLGEDISSENVSATASDTSTQINSKNETKQGEIRYKEERSNALSTIQAYKIRKTINEGNSKYEIKSGTKLYDVFKLQKQSGYLNDKGRWVVVKDDNRFVIIYRSDGLNDSVNNPQWSLINEDIKALNGTAIKYTPELGYQDPKLDEEKFTLARKVYLRFMELGSDSKYSQALNGDNVELREKTENLVMGIVAKEFGISLQKANDLFFEGVDEDIKEINEVNSERGSILTDEQLLRLINEQGDYYIPE